METNPKIVVFQLKELIYTVIFIVLAIFLILLLIFMFLPREDEASKETSSKYVAGTYSSNIVINNIPMEVSVKVDSNHINSIDFTNLSETVNTMYPLMESSLNDIEKQVLQNQSTQNIYSSVDNKYTYSILVDSINNAIKKALR